MNGLCLMPVGVKAAVAAELSQQVAGLKSCCCTHQVAWCSPLEHIHTTSKLIEALASTSTHEPFTMRRLGRAAAALAAVLVLLQCFAAPAQAGRLGLRDEDSPPPPESPRLGAIHFGEMESIDPFERSRKQEVEEAGGQSAIAGEPGGLEEEGEKKETIAEVSKHSKEHP